MSTIYRQQNDSYLNPRAAFFWNIAPAEVSGFCNATENVNLQAANTYRISVFVMPCFEKHLGDVKHGDAHSGRPTQGNGQEFGKTTSSFLVEEYCPSQ